MCRHGTDVVLTTPEFLWSERAVPERGIAIDACIAPVVAALWEQGIVTLGSCCGHGTQRASLVLNQDIGMPDLARLALDEIDPHREWSLLQWQLIYVAVREVPPVVAARVFDQGPDNGGGTAA